MSRRAIASQSASGQALVATLGVATLLGIVGAIGLQIAQDSNSGAAAEGRTDLALQVADAAANLYVSRLQSDDGYFEHFVDPAEDQRVRPDTTTIAPGSAVPSPSEDWTYAPGEPQNFTQTIQNARFGAATYNLRVTRPPNGSQTVTILASGRVGKTTRTLQMQVRPGSIADFQMVADRSVSYGATATTNGKIYANGDINHAGIANEKLYASNQVTCGGCAPGSVFDKDTNPTFTSQFPSRIDFSRFSRSTLDVKDAAISSGGLYLNSAGAQGNLLQFLASGQVTVWPITGGVDLANQMGTLGLPRTYPVPANGAIYSEQDVVVSNGALSSVVSGKATVVSAGNVYIGGNITYAHEHDIDVLGLIATNSVFMAQYAPDELTWRAATIAQSGTWETAPGATARSHFKMTYKGSTATKRGGQAGMFKSRDYSWDADLAKLPPPFWPRVGSWLTQYWREVESPR